MNKNLYSAIFYAKNSLIRPELIKDIYKTWNNQFITKMQLQELQFKKLKRLLTHAYNNCPFYTHKFEEAGFNLNQFNDLKDIQKVPFLTKQEIKDNLESLTATNIPINRREVLNTGGTTGMPMKFYRDRDTKNLMYAMDLRTIRMYGCNLGSKKAWIWGLKEEDEHLDFRNNGFKSKFLKNTVWYNGFDMNPDSMKKFALFSKRYKPELIISYVSSLFEYAKYLERTGITFYSPKAIWLTAEPVEDYQRSIIEEIFKCPTFSQYGASEVLHMATECTAHEGLHIHADSRYIEITGEDGSVYSNNKNGYITVTDLENYVMPIIRYRNDDISSYMPGSCKCGNNFPRLNPILGRVYNVFKLKGGKQIYGHMFSRKLFTYVKEINQFQIHQTNYDTIKVYIVPGNIKSKEILEEELVKYFKHYTNEEVNYTFHYVDNISKEKSGKLLYTKSDIQGL